MTKDKLEQIRKTLGFSESSPSSHKKEDFPLQPTDSKKATSDDVPFDPELNQDFDRYFTQHTFASHPLSKFALVSFGSAVVVVILVIFYSLMQSSERPYLQANATKQKEDTELFGNEDIQDKREMDELKARLALSQQKPYTKPTRKQEAVKKPEPVVVKKVTPPAKSNPVSKNTPPQPIVRRQPIPSQKTVVREVQVDPQKRWHELTQIGSYKSEGSAEELPLLKPKLNSPSTLLASNNLMVNNGSSLPTQKVMATLEGGIALPIGVRTSEKLSVALVLLEPLLDRSDNEVVPVGAVIIADVSITGSVVQFTPKTLSFEWNEEYHEIPLSQGSVMITGNQGPIIARTETVGQDGGGLSVTQMGQLVTAAGGFVGIEGARDLSLIFNALGGGNSRSGRLNQDIQLYTVREGTEVIIRIVRNLPLNISPSITNTRSRLLSETTDELLNDQNNEELDFDY